MLLSREGGTKQKQHHIVHDARYYIFYFEISTKKLATFVSKSE